MRVQNTLYAHTFFYVYAPSGVHSELVFSRTRVCALQRIPAAGQRGGRIPVHIPGVPCAVCPSSPPPPRRRSSTAEPPEGDSVGGISPARAPPTFTPPTEFLSRPPGFRKFRTRARRTRFIYRTAHGDSPQSHPLARNFNRKLDETDTPGSVRVRAHPR